MSNNTRKSLRDRAKEFDVQLPLMEGRDKGDTNDLIGQVSTIIDYGFLPNETGEFYAVFIVKERPNLFFFGGSVLTARLTDLDAEGYHDEVLADGLPMLLTTEKAKKSNRTYTGVKFYPDED